jgi:RHS repeat-associated protein
LSIKLWCHSDSEVLHYHYDVGTESMGIRLWGINQGIGAGSLGDGGIKTYRYGFNGKEMDNETYGQGNEYDFGARIYNPRLGRWLACDPSFNKYPGFSPYVFSFNSPLKFNDPDGKDPFEAGKEINVNLTTFRVIGQKDNASFSNSLFSARDPKLFAKAIGGQEGGGALIGAPFEKVGLGEWGKQALKWIDKDVREFDDAMDDFQNAAFSDKYTLREYGDNKLTDRTVENLGKGFEASVTYKAEYDVSISKDKNGKETADVTKTKETFYSLHDSKDKAGKTKQVWEVQTITYNKDGSSTFKREADIDAKPVDKNHK